MQDFKGRCDENEDWDVESHGDEELLCDSGKIVLEPAEGTRVEFSSRSVFFLALRAMSGSDFSLSRTSDIEPESGVTGLTRPVALRSPYT